MAVTWGGKARVVARLLVVVLAGWVAVVGLLSWLETPMVFPAPRYPQGNWQPAGLGHEDVTVVAEDGTRLHGWLLDRPGARRFVLYFHGNGEHVAHVAPELDDIRTLLQATVLCVDYRGYGRSEGSPSQQGLYADGRAALDWLCERYDTTPNQVTLVGRSLGGAVAIDVASRRGARALVLDSAFSSMVDVAAHHYPWAPVRLVMRNRFVSTDKLASWRGPLVQLHGTDDWIVPIQFARRLFEACPSAEKHFLELPGLGHNDPRPDGTWVTLDDLLP